MATKYQWRTGLMRAVWHYYLSGTIVLIGVMIGNELIYPLEHPNAPWRDPASACIRFDGKHYKDVTDRGYSYDPSARSTVAFFPAYPLSARAVKALTGCSTDSSLLLVANTALVLSMAILYNYLYVRLQGYSRSNCLALWTFALWPTSFFFRMAYAESAFILCSIVVLYGIVRKWPFLPLAAIAGLATSTRPVGIAASLALLWYFATTPDPIRTRAARLAIYGPLAFWGVLTYSAYQFIAFDEPLAFTQTQSHWTFHSPPTPTNWADRAIALATLEPARGVYDPSSSRHWRHMDTVDTAISSLGFWNPLLFGLAGGCIVFGWAKRWLTGPEVVYGAVSLLVPYVTRSYDMSMASHGRFAAAVIPMYLIIGKMLSRLPAAMSNAIIFCLGGVLIYWTALYVAGYNFF